MRADTRAHWFSAGSNTRTYRSAQTFPARCGGVPAPGTKGWAQWICECSHARTAQSRGSGRHAERL